MREKSGKTTRRTFLKQIATTAVGATIGATDWKHIYAQVQDRSQLRVFSEGRIGSLRLVNRLIRAAILERAASDGGPTDAYLRMYESQAAGGVGLIMTGAMAAVPPGMSTQIHAYDDRHIPGLQKIVASVRATNKKCKVIGQVICLGDFGPSGVSWSKKGSVRALSVEEVEAIIRQFAESIGRLKDASFDGAELNGHYVYVLSSFLSPHTNKRNDKYGGTVENRARIVQEIVEKARKKVGPDFPILIKLNCDDSFSPDAASEDGTNLENFHLLAAEIEKAGIDAIELSGNTLLRTEIDSLDKESYFSKYAETLDLDIPVILTGGNRTIGHLEEILGKGKVKFFGLARPLIREPHLVSQWLEGTGSPTAKCISCNGCLTAEGPLRCIQETG